MNESKLQEFITVKENIESEKITGDKLKQSYIDLYNDFQHALSVNRKLINITGELLTELENKNQIIKLQIANAKK